MAATSAAAILINAVLSHRRTARRHGLDLGALTRGGCECTRGDCANCPARWSL
ncbi:hypothetical protein L2K20_26435 [Mycobacterium sp. MBM]|nr:hypothetical protein [Mycobacterium sp. MBM]